MKDPTLDKGTEVQGLWTAVLFPSIDLFDGSARKAAGPLTPIVGVSLFQRTVLTLQRAGIRQLIVLAGPEADQLKQSLLKGPRVTIPVRWMPTREFPLDDVRTWEALAAEIRGFCLLSGVGTVFSRSLIEELRRDVRSGKAIVVGPHVVARQGSETGTQGWGLGESAGIADFIVMPASELTAVGQLAAEYDAVPTRRWLERAAMDGRLRVLSLEGHDQSRWYQAVRVQADVREAERRLYSSL